MTVSIAQEALDDARAFLENRGALGSEGTGMLAGVRLGDDVRIDRFFAPDQEAGADPSSWVEVTERGKRELVLALRDGELWVARIHSHPGRAFHSWIDDRNPGLTADGSLSIVVPFYGLGLRRGLDACGLFELRDGAWRPGTAATLNIDIR